MAPNSSLTNVSALHVFQILRLISRSEAPLGTAEISRMIGLPLSTVHRALVTLEEAQYISRWDTSGQYVVGLMPQHLSRGVFRSFPLRAVVEPHLNRLAMESGETGSLCARVGWRQMTILVVQGHGDVYHRTQMGAIEPLHRGIASLAILAFLEDSEIDRYLEFSQRYPGDAPPADEAQLRAGVAAARSAGYLTEESDTGLSSIALPLRDPSGQAIASILLSGRQTGKRHLQRKLALRREIEAQLRADPPLCLSPYGHLDPDDILFGNPS